MSNLSGVKRNHTEISPDETQLDKFYRACRDGNFELLQGLDLGMLNLSVSEFRDAILNSIDKTFYQIAEYLIDSYANIFPYSYTMQRLTYACMENCNHEFIQYLLNNGADINAIDSTTGESALMYACKAGNFINAKYLIDNGANISVQNLEGETALNYACQSGNYEIFQYLISRGALLNINIDELLRNACMGGNFDIFHYLANQSEVDLQSTDFMYGENLLMLACFHSNLAVVEYLVHNIGVHYINEEDERGKTALMYASQSGNYEIVQYLLWLGTSTINSKDIQDYTALHYAVSDGNTNLNIIKCLLENGADVNAEDKYGRTAIETVVDPGVDLVELVQEYSENKTSIRP